MKSVTMERLGPYLMRKKVTSLFTLLVIGLFYYIFLLTHGTFNLFNPTWHGAAFNSMLLHLWHGRFDVDPATIGSEGFVRDGMTYAYFGILPAILRAPILLFPRLMDYNMTLVSCLTADTIVVACQATLTLEVFRCEAAPRDLGLLVPLLLLAFFAGPQVYMLRPSIYQEVVCWALAFSYLYVYVLLGMVMLDRPATVARLTALAVLAGLTLHTRVTTGVSLYLTTVIAALMLVPEMHPGRDFIRRVVGRLSASKFWLPCLVLVFFVVAVGYVNFMRWGNPVEFNNPHRAITYTEKYPEALMLIDKYGAFNFARVGYGLLYYFLPIWLLRGPNGNLLFSEASRQRMDLVELPPSSFLITDAVWLVFGTYLIVLLVRHWRAVPRPGAVCLLAAGLALPAGAMLCFMWLTLRYRAEFYPAMLFLGFLGLQAFLRRGRRSNAAFWIWPLAGMSIVAAPVLLVLYFASPFGGGFDQFARDGWIASYRQRIASGLSQGQSEGAVVREGPAQDPIQ